MSDYFNSMASINLDEDYTDAADSVSGENFTNEKSDIVRHEKALGVLEKYVDQLFSLVMDKVDNEIDVPEDYPERWLFKGDSVANGSYKDVANSLSTISIYFDKYSPVVYLLTFKQIIEELYVVDSSFLKYGHYKPAMRTQVEIDLNTEVEVYSDGFFNLINKTTDERITISIDPEKLFVTGLKSTQEAEKFQKSFLDGLDKNDVFRNKTFTFTPQLHPKFVTPSQIRREDVILSEKIWKQIDINAINVFRRNEEYKSKKIPTKRGIILEGPPGCQPANSKVLLGDGTWKNIQDIIVGDIVMSPQHDNSMVLAVVQETYKYKNKNTFKVSIKNGQYSYTCSDDHIIPMMAFLHNGYRGRSRYILQEHTANDLYNRGNRFKNQAKTFTSGAYDLPEKEYDIHPYVMGCMLGDGSVTGNKSTPNFTYSMKQSSPVYQDMILHGASFGNHAIQSTSENYVASVRATKGFARKLKSSKIWGTNSHTKFVPDEYKVGSLEQRLELLAGLIDTDGTSTEFASTSVQLANDFKDLIFSIGGFATVKQRTTKCNGKSFSSYRVCYSIGEHVIPTRLEYKRNKSRNFNWKNHRNHQMTVEPHGIADVYGFKLDSPSQWYITDNYLVTHNCGKSMVVKYLENELRGETTFIYVTDGLVSNGGAVSKIFDIAQHYSPCVLIFEDVDSIGGSRDGYPGASSITPELLSRLDGLEKLEDFVIVATTNYPEKIDDALRNRPNRFDRRIRVQRPEAGSRLGLLKKFLSQKGHDNFSDEELSPVGEVLAEFSGAQINEVVVTAQMISLYAETPLTLNHLLESVEFMKENYYDDKNMGKEEGKKKVGFRAGSNR